MQIKIQKGLALLAIVESGMKVSSIVENRVWFTFDGIHGNLQINVSADYWSITWAYCKDAPKLKTYQELLEALKRELKLFNDYNKGRF